MTLETRFEWTFFSYGDVVIPDIELNVEAKTRQATPLKLLLAAIGAMIVVHGFGRFLYTPLLPLLVRDGLITLPEASNLASWNYLGYLIGAVVAFLISGGGRGRSAAVYGLLANALITLAQTLGTTYESLVVLRLFNGISNGLVFVLVPALSLEWLAKRGRTDLSGLLYLGVGFGLIASALSVDWFSFEFTGAMRWLMPALLSLPVAIAAAYYFARYTHGLELPHSHDKTPIFDRSTTPLFLAYAGGGLGYVLPMTFLPEVAHGWQVELHPSPWLIASIAAIPSTWFWNWLGARFGDIFALKINYAAQIVSMGVFFVLPAGPAPLLICALLMGSAFMGTVLLTLRLTRTLHPHQGPRIGAAFVTIYALMQLAGPVLTEQMLHSGLSLIASFWFGLAACIWALAWMYAVPKLQET